MISCWILAAEAATAASVWQKYLFCPTCWGFLAGAIGLMLLVPGGRNRFSSLACGAILTLVSGVLFASDWPLLGNWGVQASFWFLAFVTLGSGVAMIATRNPVYSALWFALSLVGTSGIYLLQGAQFLGMATIVVYAGAIVVTFLFVIMLAQPEGHAAYDRLSWGSLPKPLAILSACLLVGLILGNLMPWKSHEKLAAQLPNAEARTASVLSTNHMAQLGRELFSRQLIAVEAAGTLLMAALVGAVAIVIHGKKAAADSGNACETETCS
jgi:NADH-quinone oxidoreductase subunit J